MSGPQGEFGRDAMRGGEADGADGLAGSAFPPERVELNRRTGHWLGRTLYQLLSDAAARHPDKVLIVDRAGRLSYRAVLELADRIAANLAALHVGPGDIVAVQLPNWREFPLIEYGLSRLGAVCVPLPHIYRHRELRLMLGLVQPKAIVVPDSFRGFDHAAMVRDLLPDLPGLRHVFVADSAPADREQAGRAADWARPVDTLLAPGAPPPPVATDAAAVTEIVFTSGTTGEPKGVMHTADTNLCPLLGLVAEYGLGAGDTVLMASTFGHQTGFVYGGQLPVLIGGTLVLMERWDGREALRLIAREGVTFTMGATPFLQDLTEAAEESGGPSSLRIFLCSGAPIPRVLLDRARTRLGCAVTSGWGMTEVGLVTLSRLQDPPELVAAADGCPLPGSEVRILGADPDESGPDGADGELVCRCPSMFAGYYRRPEMTQAGFAADGWFRTGDRARQLRDGYIRITGRSKDIIIRGGENIPVVEVEEVLHRHPALAQVAVVAVPDPRFQEKACAAVVLHPGRHFDFAEMRRHLEAERLARQYFPEYLVILDGFPQTPSGKIQKYLLRARVIRQLQENGRIAAEGAGTTAANSHG